MKIGNFGTLLIGVIMIFICIIMFEIVLDGVGTILAWTSGGSDISTFTGFGSIVQLTPMLLWLGLFGFGGYEIYRGIRGARAASGSNNNKNSSKTLR